ncbi:hypothetical protein CFC21_049595 [Triticum aestivum]|uniref:Knottin scorpion toxin-like domain-containing protein n=4 Tax=Triticinae TaxID=1648030 RepID=A0A453GF83_AEGTS|nr:uncharacterized protein LOC109778420 [Aegilops tauschii subsp. strangulata]XP_044353903.1 uncharacterized protein LOC123075333 [Triticum aestivum]KAF7039634.1 hypothetical protein CFC21_049595 [Triticum aestivum]
MAFSGAQILTAFTLGFLLMAFCAEARLCTAPSKWGQMSICKTTACIGACQYENFKDGYCSSNDGNYFHIPKRKTCMCRYECRKNPTTTVRTYVPKPPGEPEVPDPKKKSPPYERDVPEPPAGENKKKSFRQLPTSEQMV